jgi:hypothetical protein
MTSTTSGTTEFSLDVDDIIEDALGPLGGDYTNAIEQSKARRALNIVLIALQNKNIPLNKIDTVTTTLTDGDQEYTLSSSVTDVLEANLKVTSTGIEIPLNRESLKSFHAIPEKTKEGRPTLFTTERNTSGVTLKVWPVPDADSTYTAELLVSKRVEDITAAYQKVDLPYRYYPLLIKWLSYELSLTRQGIGEEIKTRLKMDVAELLNDTFEEDRERTDMILVPGGVSGR